MNFGYKITFVLIDKGNIEVVGAKSISSRLSQISKSFSGSFTGLLSHYLFFMILFIFLSIFVCSLYFSFDFLQDFLFVLTVFCYLFSFD